MNGLTNPQELDKIRRNSIMGQLKMKYRSDPQGFRAYLPSVAAILDAMNPPPRPSKPRFALTEQERAHHKQGLVKILQKLDDGGLSHEEAVKAFECCAKLLLERNGSLLPEVEHAARVKLVDTFLGRSHESFTDDTTIKIADDASKTPIAYKPSILRGVYMELDKDMRLISITIDPEKVKEGIRMRSIIGIGGRDIEGKRDVSMRHDDYLAEIYARGRF